MNTEHLSNRLGIAVAAVCMQICLGAVYGWSVFKKPLMSAGHWSETSVQFNFTLAILILGIGTILGGLWLDKAWPRIVATTAGVIYGLGYLIAGFAAALVPTGALAAALRAVGSVPFIGYVLLLIVGLLIAVATFVCSMGNVPVARYLANAGIPLGANTTFIYGDLLILPLIAIYRKSFPDRITWAFVGLFVAGAMLAGAIMERVIGSGAAAMTAASMTLNDRFTFVSNMLALAAVAALALATLASKARGEAS